MVNKGTTVPDLAAAKKLKWGVQTGTTSEIFLNDKVKPDSRRKSFGQTTEMFTALKAKQIDAVLLDTAIVLAQAPTQNAEVVAQFKTGEDIRRAAPKGLREHDAGEHRDQDAHRQRHPRRRSTRSGWCRRSRATPTKVPYIDVPVSDPTPRTLMTRRVASARDGRGDPGRPHVGRAPRDRSRWCSRSSHAARSRSSPPSSRSRSPGSRNGGSGRRAARLTGSDRVRVARRFVETRASALGMVGLDRACLRDAMGRPEERAGDVLQRSLHWSTASPTMRTGSGSTSRSS